MESQRSKIMEKQEPISILMLVVRLQIEYYVKLIQVSCNVPLKQYQFTKHEKPF